MDSPSRKEKRTRREFLILSGVGSVAVGLAACAPAPPPQPTAAPAPAKAPTAAAATKPTAVPATAAPQPTAAPKVVPTPAPIIPVKVQHPIQFDAVQAHVAKEKGFDRENGISLDLTAYNVGGDLTAVKGMIAGELHFVIGNMGATLAARAGGAPVKVIGVTSTGALWALAVRADHGISAPKDLAGKAIGISSPGSLPHVLGRAVLAKAGVDESSVEWVAAGGNVDRVKALIVGKVDGAIVPVDTYRQLAGEPNVKLFRIQEVLPDYLVGVFIATDSMIAQRPALPAAFMKSVIQGVRYAATHKDETLAIAGKVLNQPTDDTAPIYDEYVKVWARNGSVRNEAVQYMLDLNVQFKIQDKSFPLTDAVDWQFADKAVQALGKA